MLQYLIYTNDRICFNILYIQMIEYASISYIQMIEYASISYIYK